MTQTHAPLTGRIGLTRGAQDAAGAVVALDGHWHDVRAVTVQPDVLLVRLEVVTASGDTHWRNVDLGAVLQECLDFLRLTPSGDQQ